MDLPDKIVVTIEIPRGSFVKWDARGGVDYVSPIPAPFNYGSVHAIPSEDGDPLDAVVLGPTLGRGEIVRVRTRGWVDFVDAGLFDPKVIGCDHPVTSRERLGVYCFFWLYAHVKRPLNRLRGHGGPTRFRGLLPG